MVLSRQGCDPLTTVEAVVDTRQLQLLQSAVAATHVAPEIAAYAVQLVDATRRNEAFLRGGSPRATLAVISLSKAIAQLQGRDYVVPKDVQEVFVEAVAHRVQVAHGQEDSPRQLLTRLMSGIPAPKLV